MHEASDKALTQEWARQIALRIADECVGPTTFNVPYATSIINAALAAVTNECQAIEKARAKLAELYQESENQLVVEREKVRAITRIICEYSENEMPTVSALEQIEDVLSPEKVKEDAR